MTRSLSLPPLFSARKVDEKTNAFHKAQALAISGIEAGTLVYSLSRNSLDAALILTPEVPLKRAMAMWPVCGVGFQNALGALAPPEVAVHLEWDGPIRVNGARCGNISAAASTNEIDEMPDWLIIGLNLTMRYPDDIPSENPDETALYEEGCAEINDTSLLEAWVKHTLFWINSWEQDGNKPVHNEWRGLLYQVGEMTSFSETKGLFLGVDEDFGALLRSDDTTHLVPLTANLET